MKLVTIAGLLLLVLGAFIVFKGLTYRSERSVLKFGDLQASLEEHHTIPGWVGVVAIAGGLVLVIAGSRRPR